MTSIEELNPELKGIGRYEFGWADPDTAGASAQRGLSEARRARHLRRRSPSRSGCSTCG